MSYIREVEINEWESFPLSIEFHATSATFPPDHVCCVSQTQPSGFFGRYVYRDRYRSVPYPGVGNFTPPTPLIRRSTDFFPPSVETEAYWYYYGTTGYTSGYADIAVNGSRSPGYILTNMLTSIDKQKLIDASTNSVLSKLKEGQLQLVNDLLEVKETLGLFGSTVRSIAKSVSAFRRHRPKDWLKVVDAKRDLRERTHNLYGYPESWLALQYGWKPLLGELQAGLDFLNNKPAEQLRPRFAVRSGRKETSNAELPFSANVPVAGCFTPPGYILMNKAECETKVFVRCDYELPYPNSRIWDQLGLVNLPGIIWEAVPYSFVVDQFLPIGDYLQGFTADFGLTFIGGSISVKERTNVTFTGLLPVTGGEPVSQSCDGGHFNQDFFERNALLGTPGPVLRFRNPLSLNNIANDLSLLVQAFKR